MTTLIRMNKLINGMADAPFKYGKTDCYIFTARLVKEWHGIDHIKTHDVYKSKKQAEEYMAKYGGIEALITGMFGYSCPPENCKDGDVVTAFTSAGDIAVGFVFAGNGLFKGKQVTKMPLSDCRLGWRIK